MSATVRRHLVTFVVVFVAAIAGVAIGGRITAPRQPHGTELHALLHKQIALDPRQEAELDKLEASFAVTRARLEAELRAENARIAAAIEAEHGSGPQVTAAVERSHHIMGELQNATLAHVFAMRRLLRPDQAATFDRVVVHALTDNPR